MPSPPEYTGLKNDFKMKGKLPSDDWSDFTEALGAQELQGSSQGAECSVCFETKKVYGSTCEHRFCKNCLASLFEMATKDEELLPVRCCGEEISPHLADEVLPQGKARDFHRKFKEYSSVNKMYCPNPRCSQFIDLDMPIVGLEPEGRFCCPRCREELCKLCKGVWHKGERKCPGKSVCNLDQSDETVLLLAKQEGWQPCRKCGQVISLTIGCNHMTCRCGHQFCYECGMSWKTCRCEQWNEHRLLTDAAQQVRNRLGSGANEEDIHVEAQNIRRQHECHHQWNKVDLDSTDYCQNCQYALFRYGMVCRAGCGQLVCRTCALHRMRRRY